MNLKIDHIAINRLSKQVNGTESLEVVIQITNEFPRFERIEFLPLAIGNFIQNRLRGYLFIANNDNIVDKATGKILSGDYFFFLLALGIIKSCLFCGFNFIIFRKIDLINFFNSIFIGPLLSQSSSNKACA